ncbi:MAG TPA: phosphatase PAP2 family protein [Gemmataceae bacterium]|jgi:undecaprenyl-diphosphatase|nr:phosphatase PAP2 family protein [Gemmataceae bacterium]
MLWLPLFDHRAEDWFRTLWGTPWLDSAMLDVTALGGFYVLTLVVLFSVGLLLTLRRYRTAGFVAAAVAGGMLLSWLIKAEIRRPRPKTRHELVSSMFASDYSFPSGHSMMSAVVYLTLALIFTAVIRRWKVRVFVIGSSLLLVGLIGLSRMYLGVHYPSDVLGGWAGGLVWALLCRWVEYHWVLRAERRVAAESPGSGAAETL